MDRTLSHRLRLPLVAGAFVILVAVWTGIAYQLHQLRAEALDSAERHGENITAVVSEHFLLFAGSADGTLRHLRAQWLKNRQRFSESIRNATALPRDSLDRIVVTDAHGWVVYPAAPGASARAFVGDREYFDAVRQSTGDAVHIGRPVQGRISGKIGIPFALPIRGASGRFEGVIMASIAVDGLIRSYKTIDLGPSGFITLRHADGSVVVRSKDLESMLGGPRPEWQNFDELRRASGSHVRRSPVDGTERILSFRKLPGYPFVVVVGQDVSTALERWSEQRPAYLAGGALISLVLMLLVSVTLGRLRRVERAEKDLHESENRYRTLTGLSADWYWELDQDCRFVALTPNTGGVRAKSEQAESHLGKRPWEMPYADPLDPDWLRCRALLEGRQPFRDVVLKAGGSGGRTAYLNVRGHPVYDGMGAFTGFRGITKDVTQKKRAERLLELEHTVNRSLAGAEDTAAALKAAIRDICETEGWDCGRFWQVDEEAGLLRFAEGWGVPEEPIQQFLEQSRGMVFAPGAGIAGHVWQSHEPLCVADIESDPRAGHAKLALRYGIHGAFVFPATSGGKVIGVFGFASNRVREPDERLLQAARVIGGQIGQFVQRKQAEEVLRRSEERFRGLTDLSSDMYWEQDEQFRFTLMSGTGSLHVNRGALPILGKTRWDRDYVNMSPEAWTRHIALLEAHRPFEDLELCRIDESGRKVWISVGGAPIFDATGTFKGYRGIGKDITERKREEQLRALEHAVSRDLADADDVDVCLKAVIRTVCESETWDCGRYFVVDEEQQVLRFAGAWGIADPAIQRFIEAARSLVYRRGDGLSGCAWESGQPLWSTDVTKDPRSLSVQGKTGIATEIGIHGTFVFPVLADGKIIGVLNFSSRRPREPEERLLQAIRVVGRQIGQFVRRKQAEQVLRESEARFRNLTQLSSDVYWEQDDQYRFTRLSGSRSQLVSDARSRLFGKTRWQQDYVNMTAEAWAAHIALLDAHRPFRDFELCRLDEHGHTVWLSVSGEPVFDDAGVFKGYRGVGKDITARKREDDLWRLEHAVALCLAEAENLHDALRAALQKICESQNWETGRYFRPDEKAEVLRFAEGWSKPDAKLEAFLSASRQATFARGVGLVGTAWQTGQPLWVPDLNKDSRAYLVNSTVRTGIRGAFLFPATAEGKTIGVFSFSSREVREPDERLLKAVRVIGSQIGQFVRRKQSEEDLRRFRAAMDASADMFWLIDPVAMRIVDANDTACRTLGYTREEALAMGPQDLVCVPREELAEIYRRLIAGDESESRVSGSYRCKDGSLLPMESMRRAVRSGDGHVIIAAARDVRERLAAEEALRRSNERFNLAVRATNDVIWDWDLATDGMWWNENLTRVFGHPREDDTRTGQFWKSRIHPEDQDRIVRVVDELVASSGDNWSDEYRFQRSDGTYAHVLDRGHAVRDPAGKAIRMIGAMTDITMRKEAEEKLAYLAQFDSLTGLPNRHLFRDRLMQAMARAKRTGNAMAVLFIDLDRFKLINDTLGHSAGDRLLKEATQRLQSCVRSSDTVGRFGGDEFGAIIADLAKPADASVVAQKILDVLARPFQLDGHESYVTASVGITLFPADGEEAGMLIMNADTAMYRAKEQGRNTYQYFTREMNERAMQRVKMETALRRAIERKELLLHYQPKVKIASGEVCGFEALLRWQHPEHGLVPPLEFIPVLEDTGLIVPVGEWVITEVCAQIKRWQAAGFRVPPVAVNLSARQFQQKGLEETVKRTLRESGIDPALLHFELTESLLMKEPEVAARTLRGLKELGVMLSVDDFGTGYSSLSYLKRFPIDALKIDRAFIRDVTVDPDDAAITLAIIGLAHSLKLNVIAEGVETRDQLHFLEAHGCDEMQGFLFSRPVRAEECARLLRERRKLSGTRRRAAGASGSGERRLRVHGGRG